MWARWASGPRRAGRVSTACAGRATTRSQLAQRLRRSRPATRRSSACSSRREAPQASSSIFGRDTALGNGATDVLGGLIGNQIGEAYGVGGLGMVGTGAGGGGTGEGTDRPRQPRHDRQGRRRETATAPATAAAPAGWAAGARSAPDVIPGVGNVRGRARQGDHPPDHPAPHQRGEVLLRAGADEAARARRPHHGAVHDRGVGPGHRVGPAEFDGRQRARRELHRPGRPPLGVPVAARRRHRHRVVSVRADAEGRRERGTRRRSRSARRDRGAADRPGARDAAEGADAAHIERISSLLGLRRVVERRGAGVDHRPAGRRFRDAPAGGAPARAQQAPP